MYIEGVDEVMKLLEDTPKVVVAHGYLNAGQAALEVIEQELFNRTPEQDDNDRSDDEPHLNESIVSSIEIDARGRGVDGAVGFGKMGYKASFVEYGHRMVGHKPEKKQIGVVAPRPFVRPAAEAAFDPAVDAFNEELKDSLRSTHIDTQV